MGASTSQQRIVLERDAYARPPTMDVSLSPELHSRLNGKTARQQMYSHESPPEYNHHGSHHQAQNSVHVNLDPGTITYYKENVERLIQDAYDQGMRDQGKRMAVEHEADTTERELANEEAQLAARAKQEKELLDKTEELVVDLRNKFTPGAAVQMNCNDSRAEVMACYKANPNDALKCSAVIASFVECSREAVRAHHTLAGDDATGKV